MHGMQMAFVILMNLAAATVHAAAPTEAYPSKPIRLLVPFTPGGTNDILARMIGTHLTDKWGNELMAELGIHGRVYNPHWNQTKGEMIANCSNARLLKSLVKLSISCSSPAKETLNKSSLSD